MMRWLAFVLLMKSAVAVAGPETEPFLLGGIQVHEESDWYWTSTLERIGMNTVAATVYARQYDWDSADLRYSEDPSVVAEIREAKKAGLRVVLVMRVALDHWFETNRYLWHGMIMPKDEKRLDAWFEKYGDFVNHWAEIAEREGVDVFAVGSEMNALTSTRPIEALPPLEEWYLNVAKQRTLERQVLSFRQRIEPRHIEGIGGPAFSELGVFMRSRAEIWRRWAQVTTFGGDIDRINQRAQRLDKRWRAVIRETRTRYHGPVTYAANFDQYHRVGFWDALDLMGINAYFALSNDLSRRDLATFEASWMEILGEIRRVQSELGLSGRRVLFTELGYTFRRHSTVEPWGQNGFSIVRRDGDLDLMTWEDEPEDRNERVLAIRALRRAISRFPGLLAGILYWKLSTIPEHMAIEPFVLIIDESPKDPLQTELLRFLDGIR